MAGLDHTIRTNSGCTNDAPINLLRFGRIHQSLKLQDA